MNMRKFYLLFRDKKVNALRSQLSWSHYRELLSIKNFDEIIYYINLAISNSLGYRELATRIKNNEYERLPIETKNKLILDDKLEVKDLVPNPILIRNKNNIEIVTEKALHNLILENIESFMKELGISSFIGSEYNIKMVDRNHHIDLLLFNIKFNCYVVVELKVTEFKVEYISQVQKYMNYIDKNVKEINNNNTMGILICKRENRFVIEYCSDGRIAVREYELVWYEKMTLKNKLIDDEVYSRVKDYSKEKHKVITFFEIEKLLNEAGSKYGVNIIDRYSEKLVIEVGKKI